MPTYLVQAAYTPASMAALIYSPQDRERILRNTVERCGGSVEGFWLAFGEYDAVLICQMPDNESMAAFSAAVSAGGGVRAIRTTPLLTWAEAANAFKRAGQIGYQPPTSPGT